MATDQTALLGADHTAPRGIACWKGSLAQEWRRVLDLAVPLISGYLAVNIMLTQDLAFVGNLGRIDLAAMNLANAIVLATLVLPMGLTNSVRVLGAQSYGAGQFKSIGMWTQVGIVWTFLLTVVPISIVWWFAGDIICGLGLSDHELVVPPPPGGGVGANFNFLGANSTTMAMPTEEPVATALCSRADSFARYSLLWLVPQVLYNILGSVLEAVEIVMPGTVISIIFVAINFGLNYLFIVSLGWGILGSPIATFVSKTLQFLSLAAFSYFYLRLQDKYWGGWTKECLKWRRLRSYLKLGVPMMITECLYDWIFEIAALTSGSFGIIEAAAAGITINVIFFLTPLLTGIYVACSIRMSTLLGDHNIEGAKNSMKICVQSGVAVALIGAVCMVLFRNELPRIYSGDNEVIALVSDFIPLAAVNYIASSFNYVLQGILEGQSRPYIATAAAVIGAWAIGVPITFYLAIGLDMKMTGLFIGMTVGESCKLLIMMAAVQLTNWEKVSDQVVRSIDEENEYLARLTDIEL